MLNWYCVLTNIRLKGNYLYKRIEGVNQVIFNIIRLIWQKSNLDTVYQMFDR